MERKSVLFLHVQLPTHSLEPHRVRHKDLTNPSEVISAKKNTDYVIFPARHATGDEILKAACEYQVPLVASLTHNTS